MIRVGDRVKKRFVNGKKPDGRIGTIRKASSKWKTALVFWHDIEKEFWHCWDDLRIFNESR